MVSIPILYSNLQYLHRVVTVVSMAMKDWPTSVTNVANRLYETLWAAKDYAHGRYHHVHMAPSVDSV